MYELIESVLSIGAWFAPRYWSSHVVDTTSCPRYILTIGLHVTLLEVCGKPVHVLSHSHHHHHHPHHHHHHHHHQQQHQAINTHQAN